MESKMVYSVLMNNVDILEAQKYLNSKVEEDKLNGSLFDENVSIFDLPKKEFDSFNNITKRYLTNIKSYSRNKRLFLVMGLPCSGKTSVVVKNINGITNALVVDSDDIKKYLNGYENGKGGSRVHKRSSYILDNFVLPKCIVSGTDVILPVVCKSIDSFKKYYNLFSRCGYSIEVYNVEVSLATSMMRSVSRYYETGRYTSIDYIYSIGSEKVINDVYYSIVEGAKSGLYKGVKRAQMFNNDVKLGFPPKLVNTFVFDC